MTDADLYALCIWTEARGEPFEGKVAVARVIANRMALKYASDGTVEGTVLRYDQFSAFWFAMVSGKYTRLCATWSEALLRADTLLGTAQVDRGAWGQCVDAVASGAIGSGFVGGPEWDKISAEPRCLLYDNLSISHPPWATPEAFVAKIGAHSFYRG